MIDHVVVMEEIAYGERISQYVLEAFVGGEWLELTRGSAIGHKKIDAFSPVTTDKVRLRVLEAAASPVIKKLAVYRCGQ